MQNTKQMLSELLASRQKVEKEMEETPQWGDTALKFIGLQQQYEAINNQIAQVREWYNLGVSESLYHESKRLNNLTTVLIGLTSILGILTIIDILSRVIK